MKKVYLLSSIALTVCLMLTSCNKEEFEQQPTEAEAITIAEEVLGFNIDPNQDWSMTQSGSIDVTANAGIDANEVLILDAYPYGGTKAQILGQANVKEGQTVTVNYVAPKSLKSIYVACRNAQKKYRFVNVTVGTTSVSFDTKTRAMASRRDGANPSIEEGYNTFNSELAQSWAGVIAAEATGTDGYTYFPFMGDFIPWKNSGWTDKFYQINANVIDSNISDEDATNLANVIMTEIPERENNLTKAVSTGYSIVTTGGPVTLTPIFKNSNSGDRISYYYYPEGTTPTVEQIKAMKKYTIGEMADPEVCNSDHYSFYKKTFSLVYEDEHGNLSYDFPAGLVINFIISNTWIGERQYKDIYESGGITTTTGGQGSYTDNLVTRRALDAGDEMECGSWKWHWEQIETRFGRSDWYDTWNYNRENGPANPYNNFAAAVSKSFGDYSAYTVGNGVNGSLTDYGATTYFLKLTYGEGKPNLYAKVALSLNPGKGLYIYELNGYDATSGTIVGDYNGKTYSEKDILVEFPITPGKVYAVYASGSKLGFYGWEVVSRTSSGGGSSTTTVSDVVTKKIDTFQDYYGDGRMNIEVHKSGIWGFQDGISHGITDPATPHCAVYEFAGRTFVGFEDWIDFDYNDVIYEITGAEGGEEIIPDDPVYPIYSYAFEDSRNCDYDMNDVVIKATEDGDYIILKLVAAGATLDLNLRLYNYDEYSPSNNYYGTSYITLDYNDKTEVHEMMGVDKGYMINTNADNGWGANANPIEIRVSKSEYNDYRALRLAIYVPAQKGKAAYEMRLSGSGTAPYGVIIPEDWKWPREWVNVKTAYSQFEGFAETAGANEEWYKTPTSGAVMDENGFY